MPPFSWSGPSSHGEPWHARERRAAASPAMAWPVTGTGASPSRAIPLCQARRLPSASASLPQPARPRWRASPSATARTDSPVFTPSGWRRSSGEISASTSMPSTAATASTGCSSMARPWWMAASASSWAWSPPAAPWWRRSGPAFRDEFRGRARGAQISLPVRGRVAVRGSAGRRLPVFLAIPLSGDNPRPAPSSAAGDVPGRPPVCA